MKRETSPVTTSLTNRAELETDVPRMIVEQVGKCVLQLSGARRGIGTAAAGRYIEV